MWLRSLDVSRRLDTTNTWLEITVTTVIGACGYKKKWDCARITTGTFVITTEYYVTRYTCYLVQQYVDRVFFTLHRSFYPSTYSTLTAHLKAHLKAHPAPVLTLHPINIQTLWSQNYDTDNTQTLHRHYTKLWPKHFSSTCVRFLSKNGTGIRKVD